MTHPRDGRSVQIGYFDRRNRALAESSVESQHSSVCGYGENVSLYRPIGSTGSTKVNDYRTTYHSRRPQQFDGGSLCERLAEIGLQCGKNLSPDPLSVRSNTPSQQHVLQSSPNRTHQKSFAGECWPGSDTYGFQRKQVTSNSEVKSFVGECGSGSDTYGFRRKQATSNSEVKSSNKFEPHESFPNEKECVDAIELQRKHSDPTLTYRAANSASEYNTTHDRNATRSEHNTFSKDAKCAYTVRKSSYSDITYSTTSHSRSVPCSPTSSRKGVVDGQNIRNSVQGPILSSKPPIYARRKGESRPGQFRHTLDTDNSRDNSVSVSKQAENGAKTQNNCVDDSSPFRCRSHSAGSRSCFPRSSGDPRSQLKSNSKSTESLIQKYLGAGSTSSRQSLDTQIQCNSKAMERRVKYPILSPAGKIEKSYNDCLSPTQSDKTSRHSGYFSYNLVDVPNSESHEVSATPEYCGTNNVYGETWNTSLNRVTSPPPYTSALSDDVTGEPTLQEHKVNEWGGIGRRKAAQAKISSRRSASDLGFASPGLNFFDIYASWDKERLALNESLLGNSSDKTVMPNKAGRQITRTAAILDNPIFQKHLNTMYKGRCNAQGSTSMGSLSCASSPPEGSPSFRRKSTGQQPAIFQYSGNRTHISGKLTEGHRKRFVSQNDLESICKVMNQEEENQGHIKNSSLGSGNGNKGDEASRDVRSQRSVFHIPSFKEYRKLKQRGKIVQSHSALSFMQYNTISEEESQVTCPSPKALQRTFSEGSNPSVAGTTHVDATFISPSDKVVSEDTKVEWEPVMQDLDDALNHYNETTAEDCVAKLVLNKSKSAQECNAADQDIKAMDQRSSMEVTSDLELEDQLGTSVEPKDWSNAFDAQDGATIIRSTSDVSDIKAEEMRKKSTKEKRSKPYKSDPFGSDRPGTFLADNAAVKKERHLLRTKRTSSREDILTFLNDMSNAQSLESCYEDEILSDEEDATISICPDCKKHLNVNNQLLCEKCRDLRRERKGIVQEIVESEISYGKDLKIIKDEFYHPLKSANLLSEEQLHTIFINLDELIFANVHFLELLQAAVDKAEVNGDQDYTSVEIGKIFLESSNMLLVYETYCINQSSAPILLEQLEKERELLRIFLQVSQADNSVLRRMNLKSFLVLPVQRVMKYPLLLGRLHKATCSSHRDRNAISTAQHKTEGILEVINSKTKGTVSKSLRRKISGNGVKNARFGIDDLEVNRVGLEATGWGKTETQFVLTAKFQYAQPLDTMWMRPGKMAKFYPVYALLLTLGQNSSSGNSGTVGHLQFPKPTQVKKAVLVLVKEKAGKYTAVREPLSLDQCVISRNAEYDEMFEISEASKEVYYIFKGDNATDSQLWLHHLQLQSRDLGAWRRRRNALPNIMIQNQHSKDEV